MSDPHAPSNRLRILVVDDEKLSRDSMARLLAQAGDEALAHESPFTALRDLESGLWDLVISDLRMPSMDGLAFLKEIKARSPGTEVILITAFGNVQDAVRAMKLGAQDFLTKPFSFEELAIRLERLRETFSMRRELAQLRKLLGSQGESLGLVGHSPAMRQVLRLVKQFAGHPGTVLIRGETGTAKERVARALHGLSPRRNGPFVAVSLAGLSSEIAAGELFGQEGGGQAGASRERCGKLEAAAGGTLFLSEVDDLPPELQGKLLRVLETQEFERLGGVRTLKADVRFIAASTADLEKLVFAGEFREDLLYRLKVLEIVVPPLRERREDILPLAIHFLGQIAARTGCQIKSLAPECAERLQRHAWPGNVRELAHVMESVAAVTSCAQVLLDDLPPSVRERAPRPILELNLLGQTRADLRELTDQLEDQLIRWALLQAEGNQGRAAEMLGIPRSTLQNKQRALKGAQQGPERKP